MEQKPKLKSLPVAEEYHQLILKHVPEGHKIRQFHERLIKLGVEALKKEGKNK